MNLSWIQTCAVRVVNGETVSPLSFVFTGEQNQYYVDKKLFLSKCFPSDFKKFKHDNNWANAQIDNVYHEHNCYYNSLVHITGRNVWVFWPTPQSPAGLVWNLGEDGRLKSYCTSSEEFQKQQTTNHYKKH